MFIFPVSSTSLIYIDFYLATVIIPMEMFSILMSSRFTFIIVGGLVAYDITDISDTGYIQPVYRISQSGGDPGANFTMNNVIYDNATIIVRPYDRQLLIQNYGNSEPSENKLMALDLDMVSNLNSSKKKQN